MPLIISTSSLTKLPTKRPQQRTLLKGLLILTCLALAIYGHEAGRSSANYVRNPRRGPRQALLQHATKRIAGSGSDISAFVDELGPQLSPEASITVVGSDEFDELTVRWTAWEAPSFQATVQVYTEEDVSNTVISMLQTKHGSLAYRGTQIKVSNKFELPWLAVSGRHGGIRSLGKLDSGVQINMDHLDSLVIGADGETATIGGGILSGEVTSALWDKGKWTSAYLLQACLLIC